MSLGFAVKHRDPWVKETRFGDWFQATQVWDRYVLGEAVGELLRLLESTPGTPIAQPRVLDVGCGGGAAFPIIEHHLQPSSIVAIDIAPRMVEAARDRVREVASPVEINLENVEKLSASDESFDVVFCHQTVHHLNDQDAAVHEFLRVLKPGGLLLFAESCRSFIHSLPVRLLFHHPDGVQKTSDEYLRLLKGAGFVFSERQVSNPYPFWSRPDFGLMERFGGRTPSRREHTQVNVVARRPHGSPSR